MKTGEAIVVLVSGTAWVCGIALVKGFWMTLAAVIPPVPGCCLPSMCWELLHDD